MEAGTAEGSSFSGASRLAPAEVGRICPQISWPSFGGSLRKTHAGVPNGSKGKFANWASSRPLRRRQAKSFERPMSECDQEGERNQ